MKTTLKRGFGIFVLLISSLVMFVSLGENAEAAAPPTGRKLKMSAYTMAGDFKGNFRGTLEIGNWEYAALGTRSDGVYLEYKRANTYTIKSANPYTKGYDYWNFSSRGYIYLDSKSNAEPFLLVEEGNGYYGIYHDGVRLNTYFWGGGVLNYISLGEASGYDKTKWKFQ